MKIRDINSGEEAVLWELFRNTIHHINSRDYSTAQVEAWAPSGLDGEIWRSKMVDLSPFVVEENGQIVGYSDLQPTGLIDHLFVHHEWQRTGVGALLMQEIERRAIEKQVLELESHVSITARPFFEAFHFSVQSEQYVEVRGEQLRNYVMRRTVSAT